MMKLNKKIKIIFSILFAFSLFFIANGSQWFPSFEKNKKINKSEYLKFSHAKHSDADCNTCHTEIEKSTNNISKHLPTHSECQTCHEEEVNANCGFCHVNADEPVAIPKIKSELIFNHEIHLSKNKLSCVNCHSDVDKTDLVSENNFPKMETCSTCHNDKTATSECEKCHSDISSLRPKTHSFATFRKEHGSIVNSKTENLCMSCHNENDCSTCHSPAELTTISSVEKIGMLSPRKAENNLSKTLSGEFVHDLNYRFTHGIEAKGKSLKCQSCHQNESFCNDCHKNGSAALGGAIPTSHEDLNFITIGVGSGGGLHAKLAKRDIESCANCHDSEGNDPSCITCHMDPDGIKNTNPKTHKNNFYSTVNGNWHSDENASCFTCHVDGNAKPNGQSGIAFCGYCHGKK